MNITGFLTSVFSASALAVGIWNAVELRGLRSDSDSISNRLQDSELAMESIKSWLRENGDGLSEAFNIRWDETERHMRLMEKRVDHALMALDSIESDTSAIAKKLSR